MGRKRLAMNRGWRRKKRQTFAEFDRAFELFISRLNKHALMVKVNGTTYGRVQLIHKGGKP